MSPCGQPGEGLNGGRVVAADEGNRAWAATVQGQASIQRRSLAWPAPRPRLLVGAFTAMNTMSAIASAHHFGQAVFDDGQLAEIRVVPGSDALGADVNDRHLDLEAPIGDRKGFNRSLKGVVPAE